MVKTALKVYRDNIINVFALIGFVAVGVVIGAYVVTPLFSKLAVNSFNTIANLAKSTKADFDVNKFASIMKDNIQSLDWNNPIGAFKTLFNDNGKGLLKMIVDGLTASGLSTEHISVMQQTITSTINSTFNSVIHYSVLFLLVVGISSFIGYLLIRLSAHLRSSNDTNFIRLLFSFIFNFANTVLVFYLIYFCFTRVKKPALLYGLIAGIFLLMLLLTLIISLLFYKPKGVKFFQIFNFKTILELLLASFVVVFISIILISVMFIFCDIVALLLAVPLVLITTIIIENVTTAYVSEYKLKIKEQ